MSFERTNYAVISDTGEDCTKTHCTAYSRAISKDLRCDGCERELCGSCSIKLGGDVYCPACAMCCYWVDVGVKCDGLAVAWCSDCGDRLCEHHSAKLPDADLCIDCASDRHEAMIHQDEIQLEIYRAIEAQS